MCQTCPGCPNIKAISCDKLIQSETDKKIFDHHDADEDFQVFTAKDITTESIHKLLM